MNFNLAGNDVVLLAEKALWIPSLKTLVMADLHLGKVEHFRSAGIAIPSGAGMHTLSKLAGLIRRVQPQKVIFLGDLFHSIHNRSVDDLRSYFSETKGIDFVLVLGNHDIMSSNTYDDLGLSVANEYYLNNLWLTHEPKEFVAFDYYNIAGHIHPGVHLKGRGKQRLTLPCFYFSAQNGILPAFGYFTGKAIMKSTKETSIFAIADDKVIQIPTI